MPEKQTGTMDFAKNVRLTLTIWRRRRRARSMIDAEILERAENYSAKIADEKWNRRPTHE